MILDLYGEAVSKSRHSRTKVKLPLHGMVFIPLTKLTMLFYKERKYFLKKAFAEVPKFCHVRLENK